MQAEGGKGGVNGLGTAADAGTRRGVQRQAAEAGWGRVWVTSRWVEFLARRRGLLLGGGRIEGEEKIHKQLRQVEHVGQE